MNSKQKQKWELVARIQALGFTESEALALRRISMTLHRWAELECGDERGNCIERAEPRKLAIWHDPKFSDGLRIVALNSFGRLEEELKSLPAHLKQDNDPHKFPEEAVAILKRMQERENATAGKPFMTYDKGTNGARGRYAIADRERGALKRLSVILKARNERDTLRAHANQQADNPIIPYHQGDPRGCALYLVPRSELKAQENMIVRKALDFGLKFSKSEKRAANHRALYESPQFPGRTFDTPESIARKFLKDKTTRLPDRETLPIESYYTRGVAVCT